MPMKNPTRFPYYSDGRSSAPPKVTKARPWDDSGHNNGKLTSIDAPFAAEQMPDLMFAFMMLNQSFREQMMERMNLKGVPIVAGNS